MPISNKWLGKSALFIGASMLKEGAEIEIKEGYFTNINAESHAYIGRVYIDSLEHDTRNYQNKINISADAETSKLNKYSVIDNIQYEGIYEFNDNFIGEVYSDRWQATSTNWSQGGSQLIGTSNTIKEIISFTLKPKIKNYFLETKIRIDNDSGVFNLMGDISNLNYIGGMTSFTSTELAMSSNLVRLTLNDTSGVTSYFGTSWNLQANTDYWLRLINNNGKIYSFFSTDGYSYMWLGNSYVYKNLFTAENSIALSNSTNTSRVDYLNVFNYEYPHQIQSVLNDLAYKAGINNLYVEPIFKLSDFTNVSLLNITGGTYIGQSTASQNFVLLKGATNSGRWAYIKQASEIDFIGTVKITPGPSTIFSIGVGDAANINFLTFQSSAGQSIVNRLTRLVNIENYNILSGGRTQTAIPYFADYPEYEAQTFALTDRPYKLQVIKQDLTLSFLVNDQLVYSFTSNDNFKTRTNEGSFYIGLLENGLSPIVRIREIEVSPLSQKISGFELNNGSRISNAIDRLKQIKDFKLKMQGNTVIVIPQLTSGDSVVRTYNIGSSHPAWDIYTKKDYNFGIYADYYGLSSVNIRYTNENDYYHIDNLVTDIRGDETWKDLYQTSFSMEQNFKNNNKESKLLSFENLAQVDLERFDVINVIDDGRGISQSYRIQNMNKNYHAPDAEFTQTLTLSPL